MGGWQLWVFVLTLLVLHFLLHLALGLGGLAPDLATVAVLFSARRINRALATLLGAAVGLLRDALAVIALGADAAVLALTAYLGGRTRDLFVGDSWLFVFGYLFLGKWLHDALYYGLRAVAADTTMTDASGRLLIEAPIAALYAAIVGAVALSFYRSLTGER